MMVPAESGSRSPTIHVAHGAETRYRQEPLNVQAFVEIPLLRVGYEADGPAGGFPVVLAHGWPDDVRTWDRVVPALHRAATAHASPGCAATGRRASCARMLFAAGNSSHSVRISWTSLRQSASAGTR